VRPAREEDRDDWTRRLWLPVFASAGGELKLWLTPGSVAADGWIRWRSRERGPWVWFYPRGC
jgi:hypothetical protein